MVIIPKDGLARFGYILDMKVEKKNQNPFIDSWLLTGTLSLKSGDLDSFFFLFSFLKSRELFFLFFFFP